MRLKTKILLTHPIHPEAMKLLEASVEEVIVASNDDRKTIYDLLDDEVEGMIVRFYVPVDRELLEKGKGLKVIARHAVGCELIDLAAATELGIQVVNTPFSTSASVAEHVLTFILMLAKKLPYADAQLRKGNYAVKDQYEPDDVEGKTLGLIGFGRIGCEVARRCGAFGMCVVAYDRYISDEVFCSLNVQRRLSVEEVLEESDFVSLHVPLTPETRNLIGEKELGRMKKSAYLINCSRGGVVDEAALAEALESGAISGAALDVYEEEPPLPDNPLFGLESFIGSPHKAGLTVSGVRKMSFEAVTQMLKVLRGETPDCLVNRDVLSR
ncbi:MAG TPA: hydroxyacid dehydrogenase [Anaerovoracaceae bacterium]|nr:hydroxyacid dehydrogenase [Anaerovoracaceae bacterium]